MNFPTVNYLTCILRQVICRLQASVRQKKIKKPDEVASTEIAKYENDIVTENDTFKEFYVSTISDNDKTNYLLCKNRQEMEEILFSDMNHCIVISKSVINEIRLQKELQAKGYEPPIMDIAELNKTLLKTYCRANRYVFPIETDPNFSIPNDYCFVEPEINEKDAIKKGGRQIRASYSHILGCLQTNPKIKRILILGKFGSGKNTICSRLVIDIMNQNFKFLEDDLNFKLYIACDLSKFKGWDDMKSLDDILLKFCHSYSTNSRPEDTKKMIGNYASNILCIFSGYEHLSPLQRDKVDFVLKRNNKPFTIFGNATIVLVTSTEPVFTPCFLTYFEKFFVLSQINRDNVDILLRKLFNEDTVEKNAFVDSLKRMYLTFLLDISPLILIYSVYIYKHYGARDRNQFIIDLVYLMKENKKDSRSFHNRREYIAKTLGVTRESLPFINGQVYGGFNQKSSECIEYLTDERQSIADILCQSYAKGSRGFILRLTNFDKNLVKQDQMTERQSSINNYYQLHKEKLLTANYVKENEKLDKFQDIMFLKAFRIIVKYLNKTEILNNQYTSSLIFHAKLHLKEDIDDFLQYILPMRMTRNLIDVPIAFYAMFHVFKRFEQKPLKEKVFLRLVFRELLNCIPNPMVNPQSQYEIQLRNMIN